MLFHNWSMFVCIYFTFDCLILLKLSSSKTFIILLYDKFSFIHTWHWFQSFCFEPAEITKTDDSIKSQIVKDSSPPVIEETRFHTVSYKASTKKYTLLDKRHIYAFNFITRPWNFTASTLSSKRNFLSTFSFNAEEIENNNLVSWCVDNMLGEYFQRLYESYVFGEMKESESDISELCDIQMVNDLHVNHVNVPVFALPDAKWVYHGETFIIEFKTIQLHGTKKLLKFKVQEWLRQIACSQLSHEKRFSESGCVERYLLVVIFREVKSKLEEIHSCSIVEVKPDLNVPYCYPSWVGWISSMPLSREKLDLIIKYHHEEETIQSIRDKLKVMISSTAKAKSAKCYEEEFDDYDYRYRYSDDDDW